MQAIVENPFSRSPLSVCTPVGYELLMLTVVNGVPGTTHSGCDLSTSSCWAAYLSGTCSSKWPATDFRNGCISCHWGRFFPVHAVSRQYLCLPVPSIAPIIELAMLRALVCVPLPLILGVPLASPRLSVFMFFSEWAISYTPPSSISRVRTPGR